jgi:preprotein translocase subunit SecA
VGAFGGISGGLGGLAGERPADAPAPGSAGAALLPRVAAWASRPPVEPDGDPRLWPALSRPNRREQPVRGLDAMGEFLRGSWARRRATRADRARAARIVESAATLKDVGERALTGRIQDARDRLVVAPSDSAAVDAAMALAHEGVRREVGLSLYVEQVMGALAMVDGRCAEMATGEGKTLTGILAASLIAWQGRGVHVLTVNDYLAARDAEITSPAYRRLGLSVGSIVDATKDADRRTLYQRDVVYAADKQVIFDFLRDRLKSPIEPRLASLILDDLAGAGQRTWSAQVVQRGLYAAVVDEADSVLIDEAVTPAIIGMDSGVDDEGAVAHYRVAAEIARSMIDREDYEVDTRLHRVRLTPRGREKLDARAGEFPAFWTGPRRREELLTQALSAVALYRSGDEYIVQDGQVVIVDRSTGRVLAGRKWQMGVHQAVEAKEGLKISQDRGTTARTSYQRFFQRYQRLCGMTGTGWEVGAELWRDYRLRVVRIPTHRPVARRRKPDRVFATEARKFEAVARRVEEFNRAGRPVLVGTRSVEASERLGALLGARGIECRILNATREQEEAVIVERAGERGAVTVATNMAGRGTDIKLDDHTRALGGLVVLATERHDESRVDRQLFGRSGRQGDPGLAQAFVSLEDALIKRHGLAPLVYLCRRTHGPVRALAGRALWSQAQWAAGRKAAVIRAEVARHEAWMEMAMHHRTR